MLFNYGNNISTKDTRLLNELTRIIPAPYLMVEGRRGELLNNIKQICSLKEACFTSLCQSLINNWANHCQSLPEPAVNYYRQQGGILDRGLNRAEAALALFHQFVIKLGGEEAELSEEQKLWEYALFSAAILQGVGKLLLDYQITIYDSAGKFLKLWNPILENFAAIGNYYHYDFRAEEADLFLRSRVNLLLARFLMPTSGFAWISSNLDVLAIWLALLDEDVSGLETMKVILIRANAEATARYFSEIMDKTHTGGAFANLPILDAPGGGGNQLAPRSAFTGKVHASINIIDQHAGLKFVEWIRGGLANGDIVINQGPVRMVPSGLSLSAQVFKNFVQANPEFKNWQIVQRGFVSLGLTKASAASKANRSGSSYSEPSSTRSSKKESKDVVVKDYAVLLPNRATVLNIVTNTKSTVAVTELITETENFSEDHEPDFDVSHAEHLPHLTRSGKWVLLANITANKEELGGRQINQPIVKHG